MCWTSGPPGTSDHGPSKKIIGNLDMCCALSAQESLRKHCEKTACRDACKGHQSRKEKKDVASSGSQAGVKPEINKTNTSEASM